MREFATRAETAIVIPMHNGIRFTLALMQSLREVEGPDVMVVVVDDGATDGSAGALAERYPDAIVLPGGGLWWGGSADLGCRFAIQRGAQRLLVMPNDNVVAPDLVVELARVLDETGGIVGAQLLDRPSPDGALVQLGGYLDWRGRGIGVGDPEGKTVDTITPCDWLPGANLMFTKDLFLDIGGFDARRFPHYRGDVEFSVRAGRHGYPRVLTSRTWVYNDPDQKGMSFRHRVSLSDFLRGFWRYNAEYNVRETVGFALRYCPPHLVPRYLLQFYARWTYVFLKTQWRALRSSVARRAV